MRIVPWKRHLGLEIAAIVHGVRVEDDDGYTPLEDIFVDQLDRWLAWCSCVVSRHWPGQGLSRDMSSAYFDIRPLLFVQVFELIHEYPLCGVHGAFLC